MDAGVETTVGQIHRARFLHAGPEGSAGAAGDAWPRRRSADYPGVACRDRGRRAVPQHEGGSGPAPRRRDGERAEAIRRAGLELRQSKRSAAVPTDRGCRFMGLPTPNIFAGEHNFHSRYEWVSTYDMHKAVEVIVELCKVWEERAGS